MRLIFQHGLRSALLIELINALRIYAWELDVDETRIVILVREACFKFQIIAPINCYVVAPIDHEINTLEALILQLNQDIT